MAKIQKKTKASTEIPNASMSDIAFLLLIFFMVSTVFVKEKGLDVVLPKAMEIEKIPRSHSATIYVDRSNTISIDDLAVEIPQIYGIMLKKKELDFNLIACFRTDKKTTYGYMADIMKQLRDADVLRVSFEAKLGS
ncbi:MAG: biopolymer transporter ExbD [Candidatus Cloacimonetes bacterium]|nr:biopolymer transporter ExbD [Candidatus Cloacimonadota bacterium]